MTEEDQWRFQWPDGTWIRWNPENQSWEKEDQSGSTDVEAPGDAGRPTQEVQHADPPPVARPAPPEDPGSEELSPQTGWKPVASPDPTPVPSAGVREPVVHDEPEATRSVEGWKPARPVEEPVRVQSVEDGSQDDESPAEEPAEPASHLGAISGTRPRVGDVLPPMAEPERPGGSLWPTIIAAIIVGLSVGLLLSSIIR